MTLKELSTQYEASAQLLRDRLRELRILYERTGDPDKRWHIKRRIAELTPILTRMNELAWLLEHYYTVGGGDHDDRYGFNGKRIHRKKKKASTRSVKPHHSERIDGESTPNLSCVPRPEENHTTNRRRAGGVQINRKSHFETSGTGNRTVHSVHIDDDALLDRFFTQK